MVRALSEHELLNAINQSSTLMERLSGVYVPEPEGTDETTTQRLLERWCQNVAKGDWDVFAKRLAWDGLTLEQARRLLGKVRLADHVEVPRWASTLRVILDSIPADIPDRNDLCLKPDAPQPFEELWLPFVRFARQSLAQRMSAHPSVQALLHSDTNGDLEHDLLFHLSRTGAQAANMAFITFKAAHPSAGCEPSASNVRYRAFVHEILTNSYWAFLSSHAVLARLLAEITDMWVTSTLEFLTRLAADWPALEGMFGGGQPLGQVINIVPGLSDRHQHGQTVIRLQFASGKKIIYKPREQSIDRAFQDLLRWCNAQGVTPPLRALNMLERPGYGWVEFVDQAPCKTEQEARRYYQRSGMLAALMYALNGTDQHYENLIACGEHPVLIDLETLMTTRVLVDSSETPGDIPNPDVGAPVFVNNVLTSGLLPSWETAPDGQEYDASPLGGSIVERTFQLPGWENLNRDDMQSALVSMRVRSDNAAVQLNGALLKAVDHLDEITSGFATMYQFLWLHREALLEGPLSEFEGIPVRFLFRNTAVYAQLLLASYNPQYLSNGVERSLLFDSLARGLVGFATKPQNWSIIAYERQALERADIPRFEIISDCNYPRMSADRMFIDTPFNLMKNTLYRMSEDDLEVQSSHLHGAFCSNYVPNLERILANIRSEDHPGSAVATLPVDALIARAVEIGNILQKYAIRTSNGATWFGVDVTSTGNRYTINDIGHSLYRGRPGVAFFLAALAKATGQPRFGDLARSALYGLRIQLAETDFMGRLRIAKELGLGGAFGIGSAIYALVRVGQFLGDDAYLKDAYYVADLLSAAQINVDQNLDIMAGSAGTILGLLALYEMERHGGILEKAIVCGEHLLKTRTVQPTGYRSWLTAPHGPALTGFSHGAAGIAYALLRLYAHASDARYLDAASEAIAYENSVFDPEISNWPDYRAPIGEKYYSASWCHGAPGIGLARLGGLSNLDTPGIRQDIESALRATRQTLSQSQGLDHLCCGTMGRIDLLLEAPFHCQELEESNTVFQFVSELLHEADRRGHYDLYADLPAKAFNPGLFQGVSGIGYQLLRIAHPDQFSSVLLWK